MDFHNILLTFSSIIFEALPFVVLGVIIAGILEEYVPQQLLGDLFQGGRSAEERKRLPSLLRPVARLLQYRAGAIALGGLLGLVFPMCECGIIAVMRRLIRKGVPLSVCICYMLAGPIINVIVILSTYVAFNFPRSEDHLFFWPNLAEDDPLQGAMTMVLLRVGMGFVVAFLASLLVDWQYRRHGKALIHPSLIVPTRNADGFPLEKTVKRPFSQRLGSIAETSLHDFIDIMAFLVIGASLAAVGKESIEGTDLQQFVQNSPALAILLMMALSVLFCLCSEADAFVAANFSAYLPPASKVAFLVLGPMFDIKLYFLWIRIFRHRLIWTILIAIVVQVFVYSLLLHYLWPYHGFPETVLPRSPGITTE